MLRFGLVHKMFDGLNSVLWQWITLYVNGMKTLASVFHHSTNANTSNHHLWYTVSLPQLYFIKWFFKLLFPFLPPHMSLLDTAAAGVCVCSCVSQVEYKFLWQSEDIFFFRGRIWPCPQTFKGVFEDSKRTERVRLGLSLFKVLWSLGLGFSWQWGWGATYYNSKVRTFLEYEDISAVPHNFKGLLSMIVNTWLLGWC